MSAGYTPPDVHDLRKAFLRAAACADNWSVIMREAGEARDALRYVGMGDAFRAAANFIERGVAEPPSSGPLLAGELLGNLSRLVS